MLVQVVVTPDKFKLEHDKIRESLVELIFEQTVPKSLFFLSDSIQAKSTRKVPADDGDAAQSRNLLSVEDRIFILQNLVSEVKPGLVSFSACGN